MHHLSLYIIYEEKKRSPSLRVRRGIPPGTTLLKQLAELSHEKTGYFYDETVHSQLSKKLKQRTRQSSPKEEKGSHFSGFEYSAEDLEKQEEKQEL